MTSRMARTRRALGRLDRRLLAAALRGRSPATDRLMRTASAVANRSGVWLAVAAGLAATGRRDARSAAASGVLGIGIAASLVNGPLKFAWRRDRPAILSRSSAPLLPLPRTYSFPSGHAASAFAFATGATRACAPLALALAPSAATVAYSRVHTGVHYPSDVVVGSAVGAAAGLTAARVVRHMREGSVGHVDGAPLGVAIPRHAVLVTSADARSADALPAVRDALARAGWSAPNVIDVDDVAALARTLSEPNPPLVIAAGGDGTVCAASNAVLGTAALLAIVPLGTSNDVARSLGIPPDPTEAVAALARGRVYAVDAAHVRLGGTEPRTFLNAATIGLNVAFARMATDTGLRARLGALTYPFAAARAVRGYQPFECELDIDGRRSTWSAVHMSVSNAPVFGGLLGMRVPNASMTDGLLDVTVVEQLSWARLALAVADALVGRHRPVHRVHTWQARRVRVESGEHQGIAVDGEVLGTLPATFEVQRGVLRVVAPPPS